jgi:hypothetical protein
MNIDVIFNRFEAALWLLISAWIALNAATRWIRKATVPYYQSIAAIAFALFGVSDIIESFTGAWWIPWWLLVLKASCILAFIYCYLSLRRAKATRPNPAMQLTGLRCHEPCLRTSPASSDP